MRQSGRASINALAAAAVAFWTGPSPSVHVNFIMIPFEATIYLDGRLSIKRDSTPYRTPCTVEDLPGCSHHVLFKHAGNPTLDACRIDFAATRQVVVRFEGER